MRKLLIACGALLAIMLGAAAPSHAQGVSGVIVVSSCGNQSLQPWSSSAPTLGVLTVDTTGKLCDSGGSGTAAAPYSFTALTPGQYGLAVTAATGLTPPSGATYAVACASGANIDYTLDGTTTPTASVGSQLTQGSCVALQGTSIIAAFKAIQQTATAMLNVSYFK